jgi:hypothetical protein
MRLTSTAAIGGIVLVLPGARPAHAASADTGGPALSLSVAFRAARPMGCAAQRWAERAAAARPQAGDRPPPGRTVAP